MFHVFAFKVAFFRIKHVEGGYLVEEAYFFSCHLLQLGVRTATIHGGQTLWQKTPLNTFANLVH